MINFSSIGFSSYIARLPHLMSMHYIFIPKSIIDKMGGRLKIRLLCTINNQLTFQCGPVALSEGNAYISLNAKRIKELKLSAGDEVNVVLEKDTSKYGVDMPEEFKEVLNQDPEGNQRFHAISQGKQRYILQYISSLKSSALKIERAVIIVRNLKELPKGKGSLAQILAIV